MWAMGGGDDDAQEEWRRRMKPHNELPASLVLDVVLAETPVVVISLATAQVYRNGVDLEIDIRARENIGSNGFIGEDVLVGVEFSDGRRATNLPMVHGRTPPSSDDAVLAMGGGGGGQRSASMRLFLTPLPSPGELKLFCASPRRNVQEAATLLDADAIRVASSRARELWPWEPYGEYQPPDPPPPPPGGWFEATQGRADAP
ncbi:hypothetical protein RKE38_17615 [Phycicoccus sp. M110.8]|uniref:hypothetical protein n=1 Tax=Phycicoccus sp. M110.8 TaxID=3075433 RepID=UPI0028FD44AD|nr:hypothetical protein [Phycicoccus sp. M110.8]MDU0315520.1 hypothetical protein [Phycicoccus sp. M110.8]